MIQNIEIEQNILGCFLNNKATYFDTMGMLAEKDFADPVHQDLFKAMKKRFDADELVSASTLRDMFAEHEGLNELGGAKYIIKLAGAAVSLFAIRDYAKALAKVTKRRELEALLISAQQDLADETKGPDEIIGTIEASLIASDTESNVNVVSMIAAVARAAELAGEAHQADGVVGVTTGLHELDRMTGGFQAGELVLLGGRPSMGKTACALSMALSAARRGVGVAISSLEMSPESLALRCVSNEAAMRGKGMAYTDAKRGTMTEAQAENFFKSTPDVASLPIEILPANMRDIGSIYAGVRKTARILEGKGTPLGLIVIDYLQLISGPSKNRYEQISEISIALKGLAMKFGVPVLALSQLSRALEQRDNKRPMLSDLRESGQLEQDADMVIFCYRGEYYLERDKPDENDQAEIMEHQDALSKCKGKLELIVAKQRMGEIGTAHVNFNAATNFLWDAQESRYRA